MKREPFIVVEWSRLSGLGDTHYRGVWTEKGVTVESSSRPDALGQGSWRGIREHNHETLFALVRHLAEDLLREDGGAS